MTDLNHFSLFQQLICINFTQKEQLFLKSVNLARLPWLLKNQLIYKQLISDGNRGRIVRRKEDTAACSQAPVCQAQDKKFFKKFQSF